MNEKDKPVDKLVEKVEQISSSNKSYLEGRLMTIIEASIADNQQREAIKSLIRQSLWGEVPTRNSQYFNLINFWVEKYGSENLEVSDSFKESEKGDGITVRPNPFK